MIKIKLVVGGQILVYDTSSICQLTCHWQIGNGWSSGSFYCDLLQRGFWW